MTQVVGYPSDEDVARACRVIMGDACDPGGPGAAVVVARSGRAVFRAGFGMASLELGVRIEPDMVFRLGSITKQFTAVAVLMLAEQGKLALSDDITMFLPDYPTHGRHITVEHLLTHTSGIKSYTALPEWLGMWRQDMTVQQLIDLSKAEPMLFDPGERFDYCNSGYVLLGAVIEAVSGESYEQFLTRNVFEPLGMTHTCYDHTAAVIPGRVCGYEKGEDGYRNAPYLSMTQPYAAGSLASSVDDLLVWDQALHPDVLLSADSLNRAFTPGRLNSDEHTGYGCGWLISAYEGRPTVEHGGGIHGFSTYALRILDDDAYVAVLTNSTAEDPPPEYLAVRLAGEAIGLPYRRPEPLAVAPAVLDSYVGVYRVGEDDERAVTRDGDRLVISWPGGSTYRLVPTSLTGFFVDGPVLDKIAFETEPDERTTVMVIYGRDGRAQKAQRTDKPVAPG